MRHTIQEAIKLTGKSRKTLYRHMASGQLSYGIEADGRRSVETSELMRVYGELAQVTHSPEKGVTHGDTPVLLERLVDEIRLLREENSVQSEKLEVITENNKSLTKQLEAIRAQLEEKPRLEDKSRQDPATTTPVESEQADTANTGRHAFSSLMDKIKANQIH